MKISIQKIADEVLEIVLKELDRHQQTYKDCLKEITEGDEHFEDRAMRFQRYCLENNFPYAAAMMEAALREMDKLKDQK